MPMGLTRVSPMDAFRRAGMAGLAFAVALAVLRWTSGAAFAQQTRGMKAPAPAPVSTRIGDYYALMLTKKGCDADDPMGCNLLGVGYEFGYGVAKNKQQAAALYRQSCTAGFEPGCENMRRLR